MPRPPLISIIIPTYNLIRFLPTTLKSLQEQTFSDWECIIVDDGSEDHKLLAPWTQSDLRFKVVVQENAGVAAARNRGFATTHPESRFLVFQDADDVFRPRALESLLQATQNHDQSVGAHGLAEWIDEHGTPIQPGFFSRFGSERYTIREGRKYQQRPTEPTDLLTLAFHYRLYPPGLVLMRRQAFLEAGPFDPKFLSCADVDFFHRLACIGPIAYVNDVTLDYRRHTNNMSSNMARIRRELKLVDKKLLASSVMPSTKRCAFQRAKFISQQQKIRMWYDNSKYELSRLDFRKAARCIAHLGVNMGRLASSYRRTLFSRDC